MSRKKSKKAELEIKKEKALDPSLIEKEKSSSIESDLAKHPKFAKFNIKKGEG